MTEIAGKPTSDLQASREDHNEIEESNTGVTEIQENVPEENVLKFLDSMDGYLTLMDSLSSILRQGWLDLASARHSMGTSRINPSLFDHKEHSASTTLQLGHQNVSSGVEQPHFQLRKWESSYSPKSGNFEAKFEEDKLAQSLSNGLRMRNLKDSSDSDELKEKRTENNASPTSADDPVQKERLKSLSMFGALFSPKLRAAQLSFETGSCFWIFGISCRKR
ncbi:OLC1v1013777C1 [Oldenlandia corymbosa var. corymbosa]|uniref:Vacuolar ATPase assembly protein VMA22 n=1 Tax=Oldenlandia corymbosa var. corymbosa TaxID=529605 RepID=A0AAV1E183_OLDCO|nr:OLC1v1013777C1 [Oldenlandia corymbosa var. corymbosa]